MTERNKIFCFMLFLGCGKFIPSARLSLLFLLYYLDSCIIHVMNKDVLLYFYINKSRKLSLKSTLCNFIVEYSKTKHTQKRSNVFLQKQEFTIYSNIIFSLFPIFPFPTRSIPFYAIQFVFKYILLN